MGAPTVSIRTPRQGRGEGGEAAPAPSLAWSPALQRCAPAAGARVWRRLGLTGLGRSEAWTRTQARSRGAARGPPSGEGASHPGRRLFAGGVELAGPPGRRAPWAQRAGGPTRLPAPPAPAGPRSPKGLALCPLLLLLRGLRSPRSSGAAASPSAPVGPTPGLRGSRPWAACPSPPGPPVYAVGAARAQGPGPGAGPRPSSLLPAAGPGGAPRSPRQVREGCVDSFSCGERVAPKSGPFCSLYFILKLYLMLLYGRGGAGRELSQSPLPANVLFIMRGSEISCEVVERTRRSEGRGVRGSRSVTPGPVSALHIGRLLGSEGRRAGRSAAASVRGTAKRTPFPHPSPARPEPRVRVPQARSPRLFLIWELGFIPRIL